MNSTEKFMQELERIKQERINKSMQRAMMAIAGEMYRPTMQDDAETDFILSHSE